MLPMTRVSERGSLERLDRKLHFADYQGSVIEEDSVCLDETLKPSVYCLNPWYLPSKSTVLEGYPHICHVWSICTDQ